MNKFYIFFLLINLVFSLGGRRVRTSPPFAFGLNMPGKHSFSIRQQVDYAVSTRTPIVFADTQLLYGLTDRASLYVSFPFIWLEKMRRKSHGFASLFMQGEYAFFLKQDCEFFHQMTVLARVLFPTTTTELQQIRASKSISFFLGGTHSLSSDDWHIYAEAGYLINTKQKQNTKLGNVLNYDLGIGRFVVNRGKNYFIMYAQLVGIHSKPDKGLLANELGLPNNVILFGAAAKGRLGNMTLGAGFQYPLAERGRPREEKIDCRLNLSFRYYFS